MLTVYYTAISFLLLLATAKIWGGKPSWRRLALGAALAGLYGRGCTVPGLSFLGGIGWYFACMAAVTAVAFGPELATLGKGATFLLFHLAVGAVSQALLGKTGVPWALLLLLPVAWLLPGRKSKTVEVELCKGDKRMHLTALRDSGNLLRDPISGKPVLVADPSAAQALANLTPAQLQAPVELMGKVPGLRLIPYKTVGGGGLLAAMEMPQATVEGECRPLVVAFSPHVLDGAGKYQALIGG